MRSFLVADMCYHQVMAESLYYPLSQLGKVRLLLNEANFQVARDINPSDVTIMSHRSDTMNWFQRRILRMRFALTVALNQKKYTNVVITAGVEYVPSLVRIWWYVIICIACLRVRNIIFVVHNVKYWEKKAHSKYYGLVFRKILRYAHSFACLSEQVLTFWNNASISNVESFVVPFLTVRDPYVGSCRLPNKEVIRIVVQGTVCQRRKRYDHLIFALLNMSDKVRSRFKFIFQGPPVSEDDREMLRRLESQASIEWRDHYMTNNEMELLMQSCDLLLAPLNTEYGYGVFRESGIGFDCVKYQRGAIAQAHMCSPEFTDGIISYNDEKELLHILEELSLEQIEQVYQNVVKISRMFSHSFWATRLSELLCRDAKK